MYSSPIIKMITKYEIDRPYNMYAKMRNAYKISDGKSEGRPLERYRHRWEMP
jgi:hypothetical protein